ncbi:hypothetical protein BGZ80_002512 [Entomortierella chlamydospora]|uniref:Uncharacterized protein n=1 Tax=Entomortierella chlamydospora TaxID=101097 RepID=A0A9P6SX29_9FUNG|nr:hypothetical protein BGZ80_002512 [Entomortierella chlamydospora]
MCSSDGPSESILASVMAVIKDRKYRDYFKQPKESDFIDEEEVDDDGDLGPDYVAPHRESHWKVLKPLLSCNVETLGECSSMESKETEEEETEEEEIVFVVGNISAVEVIEEGDEDDECEGEGVQDSYKSEDVEEYYDDDDESEEENINL